jgi:carbohydrate binding protein with CBM4/9 domain
MILRLSSNAHRAALVAVSFAVASILSYFSIRNALAVHYAGLQAPESYMHAARLEPADPRNWYLLGRYWQYNLEDPDAARAIRFYLSALSLNPSSSEAWLDLATAYESESNLAAARDAFLHAKKVYPLSAEVSWRYGNFLLRQGELDSAFSEMRLAVEADPKRAAEAFSRSLRAGSNIETALARVLPPITEAYVDVIWDQTTDGHTSGNALKVWDRLASLHPRLSLNDSFSLVGALLAERRIAEASRVWDQAVLFAGLAELQSPPGSVLWDGGFESSVTGGGFAWLISEGSRGVQIGFDNQEKHSGKRSLRLLFDGKSNINFEGVCHFVPVHPSTPYRFSAWVRSRSLTTDQGIRFQLRSRGTQNTSTAVTSEVHGTAPWTRIELPWSSGKDVQELQVCLVRFPSQQAQNKIQGTAWVDDLALIPEPAEHPKP